jgi:Uma2 family endonuclease
MLMSALSSAPTLLPEIQPISVEAYHLLYNQGLVSEKSELIEGVIYSKMTKNPRHSNIVRKIADLLSSQTEFTVFKEDPLTIGDSEPEPDIAIIPIGDFSAHHPDSALLVIEVAESSLSMDRKKAAIYAQGNIPEYIIFNLNENKLEVYAKPRDGIYTEIRILSADEEFVSVSVPGIRFALSSF